MRVCVFVRACVQFEGYMHQDAQEFLNFLLNEISDNLRKERKEAAALAAGASKDTPGKPGTQHKPVVLS
jgi:ubiquitin C-terminal hydrolase